MHLSNSADLELIDKSNYKMIDIDEGCKLLGFFKKRNTEFCRGCTFYEFENKAEDIDRNSRIILIDKVALDEIHASFLLLCNIDTMPDYRILMSISLEKQQEKWLAYYLLLKKTKNLKLKLKLKSKNHMILSYSKDTECLYKTEVQVHDTYLKDQLFSYRKRYNMMCMYDVHSIK